MYYLKATDENSLWNALIENDIGEVLTVTDTDPQTTINVVKSYYEIDIIGTIYVETGNTITVNVEGKDRDIPETTALDGFHANLIGPLTDEQLAGIGDMILPPPATPYRRWA